MHNQSSTRFLTLAAALLALGAGGCASTPSVTESHRHVVDADRGVFRATEEGIEASFTAPRDVVWKALVGAYNDLGLLPDAADTTIWAVSRSRIAMRGVYHGTRTSQLFSCGETATGSAQADVGQIIANVRSQITAAGAEMKVSTLVDAWVIPDGGTSSNSLHCGSTGLLEAQLHKAIAARVGQAPGE